MATTYSTSVIKPEQSVSDDITANDDDNNVNLHHLHKTKDEIAIYNNNHTHQLASKQENQIIIFNKVDNNGNQIKSESGFTNLVNYSERKAAGDSPCCSCIDKLKLPSTSSQIDAKTSCSKCFSKTAPVVTNHSTISVILDTKRSVTTVSKSRSANTPVQIHGGYSNKGQVLMPAAKVVNSCQNRNQIATVRANQSSHSLSNRSFNIPRLLLKPAAVTANVGPQSGPIRQPLARGTYLLLTPVSNHPMSAVRSSITTSGLSTMGTKTGLNSARFQFATPIRAISSPANHPNIIRGGPRPILINLVSSSNVKPSQISSTTSTMVPIGTMQQQTSKIVTLPSSSSTGTIISNVPMQMSSLSKLNNLSSTYDQSCRRSLNSNSRTLNISNQIFSVKKSNNLNFTNLTNEKQPIQQRQLPGNLLHPIGTLNSVTSSNYNSTRNCWSTNSISSTIIPTPPILTTTTTNSKKRSFTSLSTNNSNNNNNVITNQCSQSNSNQLNRRDDYSSIFNNSITNAPPAKKKSLQIFSKQIFNYDDGGNFMIQDQNTLLAYKIFQIYQNTLGKSLEKSSATIYHQHQLPNQSSFSSNLSPQPACNNWIYQCLHGFYAEVVEFRQQLIQLLDPQFYFQQQQQQQPMQSNIEHWLEILLLRSCWYSGRRCQADMVLGFQSSFNRSEPQIWFDVNHQLNVNSVQSGFVDSTTKLIFESMLDFTETIIHYDVDEIELSLASAWLLFSPPHDRQSSSFGTDQIEENFRVSIHQQISTILFDYQKQPPMPPATMFSDISETAVSPESATVSNSPFRAMNIILILADLAYTVQLIDLEL